MATEAALAKAKEIAMRLAGGINSDLGKRKNRWDEDQAGVGMKQSRKIYVPVKEHPEINYLGLLIGPQGSTQKQLSASTGARIVIRGRGSSKDGRNSGDPDENDDLHVYIEGTEEAVQKAYNEIYSIFHDPESANRLKAQQLSQLSGGGGGGSSSLMSHSHDSIYGGGGGGGGVGHSSDSYQIELRIPNSMVGLIIGKGGENIVRIQTQLGVHAQIAKEHEMPPGDTHRSIVLKGSPGAVAEAKNRIEDLISSQATRGGGGGSSSGGQQMNSSGMRDLDNSFIVKLPVPNDKVGIIIGKGGITVRGIQERTGANIQIPPNPDEDNPQVRTLNIGAESKEAVDAAQMEIFMALQMQQQQSQQAYNSVSNNFTFPIPDDKVGIVIGKSGVTVKDLQNRLRVKIQIPQMPDPGSNPPVRTLSVAGSPDMQMMAKYEIEMMLVGTPIPGTVAAAGSTGITAVSNAYGMYGSQMGQYGGGGGGMYPQQQLQQYGYYGMPPQAPANMYGMQYPTQQAALYGGYPYDPSASMNPYGQQQLQAPYPTQQPAAPAAPEEIPSDPTAYYNDYWHYASYYGEAAARLYYGAWSPPEGTPPPPGVVVVADQAPTSAASDTTQSDGAVYSESQQQQQQQQQQDYVTSQAVVPTTEVAATATLAVSAEDTTSSVSSSDNAADSDPNAAALAWEKYKKEYADWYEAYGKATGADPNPPDM